MRRRFLSWMTPFVPILLLTVPVTAQETAESIVVYGERLGRQICDESTPFGRPLGPYSRSKQAQERIARDLEATDGLRVTLVRPANVFGPGSIPWVHEVVALLRRRGVTLIGGGWQNAGLCHVDNLVELLMLAATADEAVVALRLRNLITRAALVTLKEARRLVVVPREMPLGQIEIKNMLRISQAGGIVCPACPGFYMQPSTVDELVDFVVGRVLDLIQLPHQLNTRWSPDTTAGREPRSE